MAERILMNEFKALSQEKWVNVELQDESVMTWSIGLMVLNPSSLYYGGYFKAYMNFPPNYPYSPPTFKFVPSLWHPNIYEDGRLCISILHQPGEDAQSGEAASERWSPVQRVESVLLSIISLLDDAEVSSPANVDAGVMLRKDPAAYKARVSEDVERSKADIPPGFVMPSHESTMSKRVVECHHDDADDFWVNSASEDEEQQSIDEVTDEDTDDDVDDDDDYHGPRHRASDADEEDAQMTENDFEDGEDEDDADEETFVQNEVTPKKDWHP